MLIENVGLAEKLAVGSTIVHLLVAARSYLMLKFKLTFGEIPAVTVNGSLALAAAPTINLGSITTTTGTTPTKNALVNLYETSCFSKSAVNAAIFAVAVNCPVIETSNPPDKPISSFSSEPLENFRLNFGFRVCLIEPEILRVAPLPIGMAVSLNGSVPLTARV